MPYTAEQVKEWAARFCPVFHFSKNRPGQNEYFYPVDVDSWITHKAISTEAEPPKTYPYHRGTALYRWSPSVDSGWKDAEPRICAGEITLDPNGIGNSEFARRPPERPEDPQSQPSPYDDWFLDFGGWAEPAVTRTFGQLDYTHRLYRNALAEGLDIPFGSDRPVEPNPAVSSLSEPDYFDPDAKALHAYVEYGRLENLIGELAFEPNLPAVLHDLGESQNLHDLGESQKNLIERLNDGEFAGYLALTYYLFYPAYYPPDGKLMEGQWEAITVFLRELGGNGVKFEYASYSQGYRNTGRRGKFPRPCTACRAFVDIEREGYDRPLVYVAFGSHANYFTPRDDEQVIYPDLPSDPYVGLGVGAGLGAAFVPTGIICLAAGGAAGPYGWPLVIFGLAILAVCAFFWWLQSKKDDDPVPETLSYDRRPRNDTHTGTGKSATPGIVNADGEISSAGESLPIRLHYVSTDLELEDREDEFEPPAWWSYAGRWGVCVRDKAVFEEHSWSNGTWRRHPEGYTSTHANVEAFLDYLHDQIDEETRNAYSPDEAYFPEDTDIPA